ncbi:phage baseplate protein [Beijerinckia sp. L45]|uniref:phage baseplate protein n=1 Tax=Beijerinckia sp. L45 TaxID=1641855 RepID=UPI00131CD175|nr:hypothetical protein [Beijerinckia sp. L45]
MSFIDGLTSAATQILGDATAPYALFTSATRYIGTLVFDVTVREVHSDEDTITVHPVENGTPISDHVFANPQVVEITCAASDSTAGYAGYIQDVYQAMLALKATRQTFDVSTGKRFYSSMLFGNITVVTDETSEFALMVTARLQQVIISDTSGSATASQANQATPASTAPEVNTGNQTLQPALLPTLPAGVGSDAGVTTTAPVG